MDIEEIEIDPEFKSLIPPLSAEEYAQLESNLLADGCRDALVVWGDVLLDGHNRYEICTRHGIDFDAIEVPEVVTRSDAINWIINNQLGRRNLTPEQQSYLRGKRYNREKNEHGGDRKSNVNYSHLISKPTHERLADEYKVHPDTIRNDGRFAQAVDNIAENIGEDVRQEILSRDSHISKKAVVEISKAPPEQQKEILSGKGYAPLMTSDSNEWYTPAHIVKRVYKCMGRITLDPCSTPEANKTVEATNFYTMQDDGLSKPWHSRVYMNPPYGDDIAKWVKKLLEEFGHGRIEMAIALVPARTDTAWFHSMRAFPKCFIRGRIKFSGPGNNGNSAPFPSCAIALGCDLKDFVNAFSGLGDVYVLCDADGTIVETVEDILGRPDTPEEAD